LTAAAGGILAWQNWSGGTAFDAETGPNFGIIVGVEVVLAAAGAVVLTVRRRRELIPAWVAVVVGVHFVPLAPLLEYPFLYVAAALVTSVGLVSVPVARSRGVPASVVTGLGAGTVLLGSAWFSLVDAIV
jgi:hypothetical protein